MKHRIAAVLLSALLLASVWTSVPAAEKVPDFPGIQAAGEGPSAEILMVMEESGEIIAQSLLTDVPYFAYRNPRNNRYGVADIYGKIYWELPDESKQITQILPQGFSIVGDPMYGGYLYNLKGKRVLNEEIPSQMQPLTDQVTGQQRWIGSDTSVEFGVVYRGMIVGYDGSLTYAEKIGDIYNGMVAYQDSNHKWGVKKLNDAVVLAPTYDYLAFLNENLLICKKNGKFGGIRLDGSQVFDFKYETFTRAGLDGKNRIIVKKNGKWGVINFYGSTIVPFDYDEILPSISVGAQIDCERFPYQVIRGQMVYYYTEDAGLGYCGSKEVPLDYTAVGDNCWSIPVEGKGWKLMDSQGKRLLSGYYEDLEFSETGILLKNIDQSGKSRLYSPAVKLLWEKNGTDCSLVNDMVVFTKQNADGSSRLEFYGPDGRLIRTVKDAAFLPLNRESCAVVKDGMYALMNRDGSVMTGFDYQYVLGIGGDQFPTNLILLVFADGSERCFDTGIWDYALPEGSWIDAFGLHRGYNLFTRSGKTGIVYVRGIEDGPFLDTPASAWYADAVRFCTNAGLMKGTGHGKFDPKVRMTRAMLVQVLYNISGEKTASYGFRDVPDGKWYSDAVNWAARKGIVTGKTKTDFAPNDSVTREQMVTILQRYAKLYGTASGNPDVLDAYTDADQISGYARAAMAWAVENGILTGKTATTLVPQGLATRAEIAVVLMRFIKLMARA